MNLGFTSVSCWRVERLWNVHLIKRKDISCLFPWFMQKCQLLETGIGSNRNERITSDCEMGEKAPELSFINLFHYLIYWLSTNYQAECLYARDTKTDKTLPCPRLSYCLLSGETSKPMIKICCDNFFNRWYL